MAPKASNNIPEALGKRKCVLAASLASPDNVDPLAIKRRKHAAAAAAQPQSTVQPEPTVNEIRDPSPDPFELNMQRLEATGGDVDPESHQLDNDSDILMCTVTPEKTADSDDNEQEAVVKVKETDEEKLGESYIILET
jgi:hypothetical protein